MKCNAALRKSLDLRDVRNMFSWTVDWIGIFHLKSKSLIIKVYQSVVLFLFDITIYEYNLFHINNFRISSQNDDKIKLVL